MNDLIKASSRRSRAPCISSMWLTTVMARSDSRWIARAARVLPRSVQINTSVSKIMEAALAQLADAARGIAGVLVVGPHAKGFVLFDGVGGSVGLEGHDAGDVLAAAGKSDFLTVFDGLEETAGVPAKFEECEFHAGKTSSEVCSQCVQYQESLSSSIRGCR